MAHITAKPLKALDLYCGAGGAALGLLQAGCAVTGIDLADQPDYPGDFRQGDVLELTPADLAGYDLIWASPPCQHACNIRKWNTQKPAPNLVPQTRELLASHPITILEQTNPRVLVNPIRLELAMFRDQPGNHRRRWFETSFPVLSPGKPARRAYGPCLAALTGNGSYRSRHWQQMAARRQAQGLPPQTTLEEAAQALGLRHIQSGPVTARRQRLNNALPPEYSRYLATAARRALAARQQS